MTSRQTWQLTIYTENSYIPNMKYIVYMNDETRQKYAALNEKNDVIFVFGSEENEVYLYALKKYRVVVKGDIGYNIIEIRIPVSDVLPEFENDDEKIHIVYADEETNDIISLCGNDEAVKLYNNYMIESNGSDLECIHYESEYIDGKFYAFTYRQNYMNAIGMNIVSTIRYNSIETSLSIDTPCDEFDIIEDKINNLANELRKENEKALKLELEALNHRITPHFI